MKKKDVLFLCQYFYPEYNSSATLPWDTARYLASRGFQVGALCGYPREYYKCENTLDNEVKENVVIKRLHYLQFKRGKKLGRLINYFSFTAAVIMHLAELKKYKCVMVYSNPPILPLATILANMIFKTKFIFVAYDIYPEVAYASHSLSPGCTIDRVMKALNHELYKRASKVIAISDEMRNFILKSRPEINESRVCTIANWAHEENTSKTENASCLHDRTDAKFIVSYFGNMGVCQDMETILETIKLLANEPDISFLFVGHGGKKEYVKQMTEKYSNVAVQDYLIGKDFKQKLAESSCGIVSLEKFLTGTCAPSKYYSYLQSGCPVLVIADQDSYLSEEVRKEKTGYAFVQGDSNGLANTIRKMAADSAECRNMFENAYSLYKNKYAKSVAMKKYTEVLTEVLNIETQSI